MILLPSLTKILAFCTIILVKKAGHNLCTPIKTPNKPYHGIQIILHIKHTYDEWMPDWMTRKQKHKKIYILHWSNTKDKTPEQNQSIQHDHTHGNSYH